MSRFTFPVGVHDLHPATIVNSQLNRWYSLGYARLDDLRAAADGVPAIEDCEDAVIEQAQRALAEGRHVNAAMYLQAAEFLTPPNDPAKLDLYDRFLTVRPCREADPKRSFATSWRLAAAERRGYSSNASRALRSS